jgi:hypothetical protein
MSKEGLMSSKQLDLMGSTGYCWEGKLQERRKYTLQRVIRLVTWGPELARSTYYHLPLTDVDICLIIYSVMKSHTSIDYYDLFVSLVRRLGELNRQRQETDIEIAKLRQLVVSTFQLLPGEKQNIFQKEMDEIASQSSGLLDAIKLVFSAHQDEWISVSRVRDYLAETGFDFRHYRTNPLAAIGTTLKRMVPVELDAITSGSGTIYKRRKTIGQRLIEYSREQRRDSSASALADAIAKAKQSSGMPPPPTFDTTEVARKMYGPKKK